MNAPFMKRSITVLLLVALCGLTPTRTRADGDGSPQPQNAMIAGCLVLAVGGVIVWQLYKLCKHLTPPPGDEQPPATNAPPAVTQAHIAQLARPAGLVTLDDSAARCFDVSAQGFYDPISGFPITARLDAVLQVSTNAVNWTVQYRVTGWYSPAGTIFLFADAAGNPVQTNYCRNGSGSALPLDVGTGREPAKFFKLTGP